MDRKSIVGLILIALVLILWQPYMEWVAGPQVKKAADSLSAKQPVIDTTKAPIVVLQAPAAEKVKPEEKKQSIKQAVPEKTIRVTSKLYSATLSNIGGGSIKHWMLHNYKNQSGNEVDLIPSGKNLNLSLNFQGNNINFGDLPFMLNTQDSVIDLDQNGEKTLSYSYRLDSTRTVVQNLTFYKDRYDFELSVSFEKFGDDVVNNEYQIQWLSGLNPTEKDLHGDLLLSKSYTLLGDEKEEFDVAEASTNEVSYTGLTKWVATRTKYFVLYIIPQDKDGIGCRLTGATEHKDGIMTSKTNALYLNMKFEANKHDRFKFFIGPMEYTLLNDYNENLAVIMEWGWAIIRPLSKAILYTFNFLYQIIPNYGLVIIIFSIIVKIVLYPLTHKTYTGMKKMKLVMPRQKEIQKKFKDNPAKMQQEMMKLYKEAGYNPLSGCLPMLIQMPLLFPIYQVFNQTIDLRQAYFFGWIKDLSLPDTITILHTGLPFIGDFHVNPLPIIMTGLTFLQQKIAPMTPMGDDSDPAQKFNQKFMMYGMPIMFFFLFNNFSSGLVLYWTMFNVLTMGQQLLMDKYTQK